MRHYCTRIEIDGLASLLFATTHQGQLVCTARLYLNSCEDIDNAAQLESVWVNPDYRGQGHARRLLARVKKKAQEHGKPYVVLQVQQANREARRLYENAGYVEYNGPDEQGLLDAYLLLPQAELIA